jgi:hypothetical protein
MMGLPATIVLTIIVSYFFFFQKKKLSFLQNSTLYMILGLLSTNYITIMGLNLDKFETTKNGFLFIAVPLYRTIIIPLLVLLFINAYLAAQKKFIQVLYVLFFLATLDGLQVFLIYFKIIRYTHWNFFAATIVNVFYLIIGLGMAKLVIYAQKRSKEYGNGL